MRETTSPGAAPFLGNDRQCCQIRHAGLDVFNIEPLPKDHPPTTLPNVTLSAHSAFRTPEASENPIQAAWEHCRRIAAA